MNTINNSDKLGEAIDFTPIDYSLLEQENKERKELDISKENPVLLMPNKNTSIYRHCKSCGNELGSIDVDGECTTCALKRLRTLETKLAQLNKVKQEHEFCPVEGHGEIYKNKLHKDWEGKITINGVELYPIFPVCKKCIDSLTGYLVFFLEQRGIMRKGSGNIKNKFGEPYNAPVTLVEKQDAVDRLKEFLRTINLYTLDNTSPTYEVYNSIKERRNIILEKEAKDIKEWQKEKEIKLPTNQLELLKLAEKYYPCLKGDTDEKRKESKEMEWLKHQPTPEIVIVKIAKILEKALHDYNLPKLLKASNMDQQKLSSVFLKQLLNTNTKLTGKDVENIMEFLVNLVCTELGPFEDSANEVFEEALARIDWSNLNRENKENIC